MKSISQSPTFYHIDRGAISEVQVGASAPLGASVTATASTSACFRSARLGSICFLFEHVDDEKPASVIHVHPASNRTYHYWHVFVPALKAGQIYGYRVYGPFEPSKGFRFDATKVLLDPYGRAVVVPARYNRAQHTKGRQRRNRHEERWSRPSLYDWESDRPLHRSSSQTIVYEMHVRGSRRSKLRSAEATRGTYSGVIEKIPYLQELESRRSSYAGVPVRRTRLPDRSRQLLGLRTGLVLRAAPGVHSRQDPLGPVDEFATW